MLQKDLCDISMKHLDLDPEHFKCIKFSHTFLMLLFVELKKKRKNENSPALHTSTHTANHFPHERSKVRRGGDVTFWNLFFSPKNCSPPHHPPSLSLSQCRALGLTAHSPGWGGNGSKGNFALPNPPPEDGPLACGRELWRWGTRLNPAVEMAVSIKYHFQFPCFMIPGLLSTNNAPPAPPPNPLSRPSYLVLKKIDYTCRLL